VLAEGSATSEDIVLADVDLSTLPALRSLWGYYRDRRPEKYGPVVDLSAGSAHPTGPGELTAQRCFPRSCGTSLLGRPAAVDDQLAPGDERCLVGGEVQHPQRDLPGLPVAPERDARDHQAIRLGIGPPPLRHGRHDGSRMNGVGSDAVLRVLDGRGLGE